MEPRCKLTSSTQWKSWENKRFNLETDSSQKKLYWRTYNETNKTIWGKDQLRNPVKWKDKKATNVSEGDAGKPLIL